MILTNQSPGLIWIFFIVVHSVLALGVWNEAKAAEKHGRKLFAISSGWWSIATLATGMMGVGIYWLIHESSLKRPTTGSPDTGQVDADNPRNPPQNPKKQLDD